MLYLVMLIPGRFTIWGLFDHSWYYAQMMNDTGVLSVQLLALTLMVTPALLVINVLGCGQAFGRWLRGRRKHFGLGSFIYAVLHVVHYAIEIGSFDEIIFEASYLDLAAGWVAFAVFALLAATSNQGAIRHLGRRWKPLHQWVYPAAGLTFLHWYLIDHNTQRVLFWMMVFFVAKLVHLGLRRTRRHRTAA